MENQFFRSGSTQQQEAGRIMEKLWSTSGRRPGVEVLDSQCFGHAINGPSFLAGVSIASIYYSCVVRLDCIDCGTVFTRFQ